MAKALAYQAAADAFEILGDSSSAMRCIDDALTVLPDQEDVLVFKGILIYESQTDEAIRIFQNLSRNGIANPWPYFFLAHHYLRTRDFKASLTMIAEAWDRTNDERGRAQLLEWQAICQAELGFPPEVVRAGFENAITLDRSNPAIVNNLTAFETALARTEKSVWHIEPACDLRP